jgi:phosphatidylserine decarboxylase
MSEFLTYATAQLMRVLPRRHMSRFMGHLADHRWNDRVGRAVVSLYSRAYDVDLTDYLEKDGWESFDAFFTRRLRAGTRPLDADPKSLVSPADGRVESMGRVESGSTTFFVKGKPYKVDDLIGDAEEAKRYRGGAGCVIYLSPRDYHRVHAPVSGTVTSVRSMPGDYYPVNAMGVRYFKNLFALNRRVSIAIDTPPESGFGRVTLVMVAAMIVGRITVSGIDERDVPFGYFPMPSPRPVERGEELGMFHLGSTVVLFAEERATDKWLTTEGPIRLGEGLLRLRDAHASATQNGSASPGEAG